MSGLRWVHRECFGTTSRYEAYSDAGLFGGVARLGKIWVAQVGSNPRVPVETLRDAKAFIESASLEAR